MMNKIPAITLFLSLILVNGCAREDYRTRINVYSEMGHGLIIHDLPLVDSNGDEVIDPVKVWPQIPISWEGRRYRAIKGASYDLPDTVTFKFQYVELSDCERIVRDQGFYYKIVPITRSDGSIYMRPTQTDVKDDFPNAPFYISYSSCETWAPLPEVHTVEVDLRPYQDSKEMERLGDRSSLVMGSITQTQVTFEFYDNAKIKVKLRNSETNPWK